MKPVDAHCHLDFERYDGDRDEVISRAEEELEFVVNAGRDLDSNRETVELEGKRPGIVGALGLHPTHTGSFDQVGEIKQQVREHDPAAVGEIGLDHHHVTDRDTRKIQEEVFKEMLELAEELDKPVVVHSREAEGRAIDILESYSLPGIMLHCFNGSPQLASRAVSEGMKIGVTTQVLYSSRVQEIVEKIPPQEMLLETDSPFLYRGERNEPANVRESVSRISEIKSKERKEIVESTTRNAMEMFER